MCGSKASLQPGELRLLNSTRYIKTNSRCPHKWVQSREKSIPEVFSDMLSVMLGTSALGLRFVA